MQPARNTSTRIIPLRQSQTGNHGAITGSHSTVPLSQARRARQVRIGRILLSANLISQESLQEALTISQELQQPIGKVLTSTQQISDRDLQSALLAQSMMAEGLVDEYVAMESLKVATREGIPFGQALETMQQVSFHKSPVADGLEELAIASGMVPQAVLDEAKRISMETGVPLGGSLMSTRAIVFAHLNYVFECITLIGQGRITREIAIKALADVKKDNIELSQALRRQRISPNSTQSKLKLGDLLTAGSVISEKDALAAVEQALTQKRLLGEILVRSGLISADLLAEALEIQTLVIKEVVSKDEAAFALRQAVTEKKSLFQVLRERKTMQDDAATAGQALDLLLKARLVETQAVPQAMSKQQRYEMDALKALVATDLLSANVCRAAIESARRVAAGALTQQEAVSIIHHCDRSRCEVEQAARELGLETDKVTTETREDEKEQPNRLPTWARSWECIIAIVVMIGGVIGGIATFVMNSSNLAGYLICGVILAVGLLFFLLGKSWEARVQERKDELKKQEEAAKQQVNRLVKIRSTAKESN